MVERIFDSIGFVTGGLTLIAFLYACFTIFKIYRDKSYERILKESNNSKKAEIIHALKDRLTLKLENLSDEQTYDLAEKELKRAIRKDIMQFIIVALIIVIAGFIAYVSILEPGKPIDLSFRAVDENGKTAYSNREAKITIKLPTGDRTGYLSEDGQAVIKGVPAELLGRKVPYSVSVYYYDQLEGSSEIILSKDVITIEVKYNPSGTPEGYQAQKAANLLLLKLLTPYTAIAAASPIGGEQTNLAQYCDVKYIKYAKSVDLSQPISSLDINLEDTYWVFSENDPASIPRPNNTLYEIIDRSASVFKSSFLTFSGSDPKVLDPDLKHDLAVLSGATFVEMSASGSEYAFLDARLTDSFLEDICQSLKNIEPKEDEERDSLNPFATFFTM